MKLTSARLPSGSKQQLRLASTLGASIRSALKPLIRVFDPTSSTSTSSSSSSPKPVMADAGKGIFDLATEQDELVDRIQQQQGGKPTFVSFFYFILFYFKEWYC